MNDYSYSASSKPPVPDGFTIKEWDGFLLAVELGTIFPAPEGVKVLSEFDCAVRSLLYREIGKNKETFIPQPMAINPIASPKRPKAKMPATKKEMLAELHRKANAQKLAREVILKAPSKAREILEYEPRND